MLGPSYFVVFVAKASRQTLVDLRSHHLECEVVASMEAGWEVEDELARFLLQSRFSVALHSGQRDVYFERFVIEQEGGRW